MTLATLIVPCYNEERRFPLSGFERFLSAPSAANLLFVNDGSRDNTATVLQNLCRAFPERASLLSLEANCGKAEAVRQGFLVAARQHTPFVGFWDADLATPLESHELFLDEFLHHPLVHMVMGARVQLLGRSIERRAVRHYAGRGFATVVSHILDLAVYDTQCGAKLFRHTPVLEAVFRERFLSKWVFDVEIIARLGLEVASNGGPPLTECIRELPLPAWKDVAGSKIQPFDIVLVARDLLRIHTWLTRARAEHRIA